MTRELDTKSDKVNELNVFDGTRGTSKLQEYAGQVPKGTSGGSPDSLPEVQIELGGSGGSGGAGKHGQEHSSGRPADFFEKLRLDRSQLQTEQSQLLKNLSDTKNLDVSNNYLDNDGLKVITQLKNLKELDITGGAFDDRGAAQISALKGLQTLKIGSYKLTDDFTKSIAELPELKSLTFESSNPSAQSIKNLENTGISTLRPPLINDPAQADQAAVYMSHMKDLKDLSLPMSRMTDDGVEALSQRNNLERLKLSNSFNITGKSIDYLSRMTNLKELDLSYASQLRPSDIERLQRALPDTKIKSDLFGQKIDATDDERRLAGKLAHDMALLSGMTSDPGYFAKEVVQQFAGMDPGKVNVISQVLEASPYKPVIKRDAQGKVSSIAYNDDDNRLRDVFKKAPTVILPLVVPELLIEKGVQAYNRGRGNDVQINFETNKVTLEARQYGDITGRGYWRGANKLSAPLTYQIRDNSAPFYGK